MPNITKTPFWQNEDSHTEVLEKDLKTVVMKKRHLIIDELQEKEKLKQQLLETNTDLATCRTEIAKLTKVLQKQQKQIQQLEVDKVQLLCKAQTYDYITYFSDGLALVEKAGKYGFIDKRGHEIIDVMYDDALPFAENLAAVEKDQQFGFIDTKGNVVIDFAYNDAASFAEGLAKVENEDKFGFIDTKGNVVIDLTYDYAFNFSAGLAKVKKDKRYFYINRKGEFVKEA